MDSSQTRSSFRSLELRSLPSPLCCPLGLCGWALRLPSLCQSVPFFGRLVPIRRPPRASMLRTTCTSGNGLLDWIELDGTTCALDFDVSIVSILQPEATRDIHPAQRCFLYFPRAFIAWFHHTPSGLNVLVIQPAVLRAHRRSVNRGDHGRLGFHHRGVYNKKPIGKKEDV